MAVVPVDFGPIAVFPMDVGTEMGLITKACGLRLDSRAMPVNALPRIYLSHTTPGNALFVLHRDPHDKTPEGDFAVMSIEKLPEGNNDESWKRRVVEYNNMSTTVSLRVKAAQAVDCSTVTFPSGAHGSGATGIVCSYLPKDHTVIPLTQYVICGTEEPLSYFSVKGAWRKYWKWSIAEDRFTTDSRLRQLLTKVAASLRVPSRIYAGGIGVLVDKKTRKPHGAVLLPVQSPFAWIRTSMQEMWVEQTMKSLWLDIVMAIQSATASVSYRPQRRSFISKMFVFSAGAALGFAAGTLLSYYLMENYDFSAVRPTAPTPNSVVQQEPPNAIKFELPGGVQGGSLPKTDNPTDADVQKYLEVAAPQCDKLDTIPPGANVECPVHPQPPINAKPEELDEVIWADYYPKNRLEDYVRPPAVPQIPVKDQIKELLARSPDIVQQPVPQAVPDVVPQIAPLPQFAPQPLIEPVANVTNFVQPAFEQPYVPQIAQVPEVAPVLEGAPHAFAAPQFTPGLEGVNVRPDFEVPEIAMQGVTNPMFQGPQLPGAGDKILEKAAGANIKLNELAGQALEHADVLAGQGIRKAEELVGAGMAHAGMAAGKAIDQAGAARQTLGEAFEALGREGRQALGRAGQAALGAGKAVGQAGLEAGKAVGQAGLEAGKAVLQAGKAAGQAGLGAGQAVGEVAGNVLKNVGENALATHGLIDPENFPV